MRFLVVLSFMLIVTACAYGHHTPSLDQFNLKQQPTDSQQAAETAARI